jgi:hypothetical protein
MAGIAELLLGAVFAVVVAWAGHRLTVIGKAALTLRKASPDETTQFTDGQTVAVEGPVFVEDSAPVADRLFDPATGEIGAYLWHAWFPQASRNKYDFERGEFRQGRSTFASGLEAGRLGVTTSGQTLHIDFSWLDEVYDTDTLSELEVGDPVNSAKLPTIVTRHIWDGNYISLESPIGDCSVDRLTDVVTLSRDEVEADHFNIESRGITAGQHLFVHGELRVRDGEQVICGTDKTPLLVSDTGREGLVRQLRWRALEYVLALLGAVALGAFFIL